jgi:DNA-binding beta-propeller fold protein YncE
LKRSALFLAFLLAIPLSAQTKEAPELAAHPDTNFLKLPDGVYFGECVGVAVDSKGDIYVANRGKHPLMEFGPDGTFMRFIGEGLDIYQAPHSVAIDPQDNIWYVDAGSDLIVKLDRQTRLQMVFGKGPESWTWETHVVEHGATGPAFFYQPTGIAFAPDGSISFTDGYGNSRVAHFAMDGNFVKDWGRRGADVEQFNTPHGIVIDSKGILYVADRGNRRIQVFDAGGKFLKVWNNVGAPWSVSITPGPNQVIWSADGVSGRCYKLDLNGNLVGEFGEAGKLAGQFGWTHAIAFPSENLIYAAEELNYRVLKLTVETEQPTR